MKPLDDKHKPPAYYMLAEKRAYMSGYRAARGGVPLAGPGEAKPGPHKRWPQAFTRGYWEGFALGPWEANEPVQTV